MAAVSEAARQRRAGVDGAPAPRVDGGAWGGVVGRKDLPGRRLLKRVLHRGAFPGAGCGPGWRLGQADFGRGFAALDPVLTNGRRTLR
jgi:hypothetical protein